MRARIYIKCLKKKEEEKELIPGKSVRRKKGARRENRRIKLAEDILRVVVVTDVIARLQSSAEPRNNFFTVNENVTTSCDDATIAI